MRYFCSQKNSGVTRGLSWRGNSAEGGQLPSVSDLQVTTQKKNLRNGGESDVDGNTKTPNQRKISEKRKKITTYLKPKEY